MFGVKEILDISKSGTADEEWSYTMRRSMQLILPGLYLGPYGAAGKSKLADLQHAGIDHIVCVRDELEKNIIKSNFPLLFKYLVIVLSESQSETIIPKVKQFHAFIEECLSKNGKVLVYCVDGMSRAPALVIAYIMIKYGLSFKESLKHVQNKRFCVQPSPVLEVQLKEFEPVCQAQMISASSSNVCKRSLEDDDSNDGHTFTKIRTDQGMDVGSESLETYMDM